MYIRTKDGVYEVIDETKYSYISIYGKYINKDDVINDGDTIKELCDCFETVADYAGQLSFTRYLDFEQARLNMSDEATLYGYIYIILPNGAIRKEPIAKMNDKGDLELI